MSGRSGLIPWHIPDTPADAELIEVVQDGKYAVLTALERADTAHQVGALATQLRGMIKLELAIRADRRADEREMRLVREGRDRNDIDRRLAVSTELRELGQMLATILEHHIHKWPAYRKLATQIEDKLEQIGPERAHPCAGECNICGLVCDSPRG